MKRINRNKGFTLVELLVVMAISMIVATLVLISFNVVDNANVTKSAHRLEHMIRTARSRAMAKGADAGTLTIEKRGDGNYYAVIGTGANQTSEMICNAGVKITGATSYNAVTGSDAITSTKLVFRTSGALRYGTEASTYRKFFLQRDARIMEVIVYEETGAVDVNMR
jgi:prepilin-type N-terminal cleavage/methylation domain-containing protein